MIRYLIHRPTTDGKVYAVIAGLSTDAKPTAGLITGSRFVEADTGAGYLFNETGSAWAKSQQLTDAVQAYFEDHPEAIDQAAIEAMFGDQLDAIDEDLGGLKSAMYHDLPAEQSIFDFGSFTDSSGIYSKVTACLRTRDYIDKDIKALSVKTGYKYRIAVWADGSWQGWVKGTGFAKNSTGEWFTSEKSLESLADYDLKIVLATADASTIEKSAASNLLLRMATDKALKNSNVPADAKATGDSIAFQSEKALRNIPHETISQTVTTEQKKKWTISDDVASQTTTTGANDRAASVDISPYDEITLTLTTQNNLSPFIVTDASYNVLYTIPWESTGDNVQQTFHFYAPAGSAYLLINAYGSVNTVTLTITRYYETSSKSAVDQAKVDIGVLQSESDQRFVETSATANILDYRNALEGHIDDATGEFVANTPATYKYLVTGFILVNPGTKYLLRRQDGNALGSVCQGYYYYDIDKRYISGETGGTTNYWSEFTPPSNARYLRLYFYVGNIGTTTPEDYVKTILYFTEYGEYSVGVQFMPVVELNQDNRDDFILNTHKFAGKTVAILGDSIGTRQGYNTPEVLIGDDDVGVELSAYVTDNDVTAGLSIAGTTYTSADIGTEVTFTPIDNDVGKSIGTPLNHGQANAIRWWQMLINKLGMNWVNASWSGATMVSQESESVSINTYKASCAWYAPTIRRCGVRVPGSMTRNAPDYIFICRGINDFSTSHSGGSTVLTDDTFSAWDYAVPNTDHVDVNGVTKWGFKEAYAMTIQNLRNAYPSTEIICCTIPPFKRHSETAFPPKNGYYSLPQFNAAIREVAAYYGCTVCDFDQAYQFEQLANYTSDNTHPNEYGHRALYYKALMALMQNQKVL